MNIGRFPRLVLAAMILLVGCNLPGSPDTAAQIVPQVVVSTMTGTPVDPVVLPSTPTIPLPTATALPSPTPTETAVPTPTYHPMSIPALRETPYPADQITIEQTLDRGVNYSRYYASYLSEGLRIYALLTIPDGEMPPGGWPAIVFNHGYIPPEVYRTTERYIAYVDTLARNGYIVFRIDYRGHDRSEGEPTGAYGHPGYTVDVLNAVAAIQNFPQANPERIGMWGHSMGGFLTLRAMVISPDIKAGVIWGGVVGSYSDLLAHWRRRSSGPTPTPPVSPSRRWRNWAAEFGPPESNPIFWDSVSANTYLEDVSGPIQLHHGTADESVPLVLSQILSAQLQAAGKTVELYEYPEDNHNISNYFVTAMIHTVEFFDRYLKQ